MTQFRSKPIAQLDTQTLLSNKGSFLENDTDLFIHMYFYI